MNKTETSKSATVAAKAQKELDIAKRGAKELSGVVTQLQRRLDRLEGLGSAGSDKAPLESGSSDDGWGPGPGPGRPRAPGGARQSDHMPSGRGSGGERDEWLSADYRRRRDPLRTPVHPKRPKRAPEPAPPAYGRYGALRDEVPEEDMEWDIDGADGDPMEDFGITPPRGERRGAASRSRRYREEEEQYMEGVRRGVRRHCGCHQ